MKYIVSLSGGIGSYMSAKRVIEKYGKENTILVFMDVLEEDGDLYRFLYDIENKLGLKIVRLCDGRTPTQLQIEDTFIYNSRVARCSGELKSKVFMNWLETLEEDYTIVLGFDWSEQHRCEKALKHYAPNKVIFPLCEKPYLYKQEMIEQLNNDGISIPRLYKLGFTHNNCGGHCVKAGMGHYLNLLQKDKNEFMKAENLEQMLIQKIREKKGDSALEYSHLKRYGKPYTLKQLRLDYENDYNLFTQDDYQDIGGCQCFSEEY